MTATAIAAVTAGLTYASVTVRPAVRTADLIWLCGDPMVTSATMALTAVSTAPTYISRTALLTDSGRSTGVAAGRPREGSLTRD